MPDENPEVVEAELVEEETSAISIARPAVIEAQERAQTDVMIEFARRNPRPEIKVIRQRIISDVTEDVETAEDCFYTLKRKDRSTGKEVLIQGPSVRLAQIALSRYRNIRAGSRVTENDGRKVTGQGFCHDVENNVFIVTEVSRRITTKTGKTFSEDMQIVTANAACAIARRNAIFEVIPRATLIDPAYEAAKKCAVGDVKTLETKRKTVLGRFAAMGVTHAQILNLLSKENTDSIDVGDLELLIGLGTAIKDKEITIDYAFKFAAENEEPEQTRTRLKSMVEEWAAKKNAERSKG